MLARTTLTLLLCTTSTLALAREPVPARAVYSGGIAPALLAARVQDPMNEPVYSEPTPSGATGITRPEPTEIRPPKLALSEWQREQRKLKAQTAVSWVFTGLGAAGLATTMAIFNRCKEEDRTRDLDCRQERQIANIGAPIAAAVTVASLIPAIIYSARLARHNRYYNEMARVSITPGGLMLRF